MSDHFYSDTNTRAGTIGGTLFVTVLNIFESDVIRSIGFAALGATVSFFVSLGWKLLVRWFQRRNK